jgi:hypothetical protein
MASPPTGTVTFLFTDIEGSTKLWENDPEAMQASLARHDQILAGAIDANEGHVFKTVGDAFCATFPTAPDALEAQHRLLSTRWEETGPLRVRMALHMGTPEERGGDYFGPPLNRVARLLSAAHGGQVLLSLPTQELVRDQLMRLLTLSGPGGTGKTRLALQAAADLLDDFTDGTYFAPLATLTEADLFISAVAETLGVRETGEQPLFESLKGLPVRSYRRALRQRKSSAPTPSISSPWPKRHTQNSKGQTSLSGWIAWRASTTT